MLADDLAGGVAAALVAAVAFPAGDGVAVAEATAATAAGNAVGVLRDTQARLAAVASSMPAATKSQREDRPFVLAGTVLAALAMSWLPAACVPCRRRTVMLWAGEAAWKAWRNRVHAVRRSPDTCAVQILHTAR